MIILVFISLHKLSRIGNIGANGIISIFLKEESDDKFTLKSRVLKKSPRFDNVTYKASLFESAPIIARCLFWDILDYKDTDFLIPQYETCLEMETITLEPESKVKTIKHFYVSR